MRCVGPRLEQRKDGSRLVPVVDLWGFRSDMGGSGRLLRREGAVRLDQQREPNEEDTCAPKSLLRLPSAS